MDQFDDILVAIHGIGEQSRNSTVRSVATRLAQSSFALRSPDDLPPLAPQPLGWFYSDAQDVVKVAALDTFDAADHPLARTGFTEVFWADIPEDVVREGRTIEETKAWARTVVARARAVCKRKVRELRRAKGDRPLSAAEKLQLLEPDFSLAAEVLEEVIETVYVLENLLFLAEKAGLGRFDLKRVLDEYLGDVQIMTEFTFFRREIIGRFHQAMEQISRNYPKARIHLVSHSEGTVVSFLGLLHALSGERCLPAAATRGEAAVAPVLAAPAWLEKLHSYMTIGSPIDKHILIWPHLFDPFDFTPAQGLFKKRAPIKWRNYYDYGDPIGFKLETARAWLARHQECQPFEFEKEHDFGFARYVMPGKAHNDYWDDPAVFEHFIQDAVKDNPAAAKPPRDRRLVWFVSPALPYVFSFALLFIATFILYRAVSAFTHPSVEPLQRYQRFTVLGLSEVPGVSQPWMLLYALAISMLIAGVTLLARLPRLAVGKRWAVWGFLAFLVGCGAYGLVVGEASRVEIGYAFLSLGKSWPTYGVLLLALLVGLISLVTVMPSHEFGRAHKRPRKQRWFRRGMRPLIAFGALAVLALIVAQLLPHSALSDKERATLKQARKERLQSPSLAAKFSRRDLEFDEVKAIDHAHLNRLDLNVLLWPQGVLTDPGPVAIKTVTEVLAPRAPVWPVLLSGAAFLYLWWLAALLFDLGFVWHRYIRNSLANDRLMLWSGYKASLSA